MWKISNYFKQQFVLYIQFINIYFNENNTNINILHYTKQYKLDFKLKIIEIIHLYLK